MSRGCLLFGAVVTARYALHDFGWLPFTISGPYWGAVDLALSLTLIAVALFQKRAAEAY